MDSTKFLVMKILAIAALSVVLSGAVVAQSDPYVINRGGLFTLRPVYASWKTDDGSRINQAGALVSLYLPMSRAVNISFRGGQSTVTGDAETVSGMTDIQMGFGVLFEKLNLAFSAGFNLPTGKRELTQEQFETSVIVSSSVFAFPIPSWGQGFGVNPGLAWVAPINDNFVVGLASAFYVKGEYIPVQDAGTYDPGDEITFAGGVEVKPSSPSAISADVIATLYGKDEQDGQVVLESGTAISANVQYKHYFGAHELWALAKYRNKAKSQVQGAAGLVPEDERLEPNRLETLIQYSMKTSNNFLIGLSVDARFYEQTTAVLSGVKIFGFGVTPTIIISPSVSIPVKLHYSTGTFKEGGTTISGFDAFVSLVSNF